MISLYKSPVRVYLILILLAGLGLWSGFSLPISLFPNSTKPEVEVCIPSEMAPEAFLRTYGEQFEDQLKSIATPTLQVEKTIGTYKPRESCVEVDFRWGGDPQEALKEVQNVAMTMAARLPPESRDKMRVWAGNESAGFLAILFYSDQRSMTDTYKILDPLLRPSFAQIRDAQILELWNPQRKQLLLTLKPEAMAEFALFPREIAESLFQGLVSFNGGTILSGAQTLNVNFPKVGQTLDDLRRLHVPNRAKSAISLGDVAQLDLGTPVETARVMKTDGRSSVMLYATPKAGGNVKAMSEAILQIVKEKAPQFPKDIQYRTLVDPSEFIRSAVGNVSREVILAALIAVVILFLFIGSVRNVATAAIEIPISIILAFILMRLSHMNLNLISLGGLALSAGMNVDASVVVMENIFRVFHHEQKNRSTALSYEEKAQLVFRAVQEVKFAVIASTVASLVVFIPLAFTSDLSYALLGDLAKAVVFSHGFSAVVALVLVPTIRLQMLQTAKAESVGILEPWLLALENFYARLLAWFLARGRVQSVFVGALLALLVFVIVFIGPRLKQEIMGSPDTDWLVMDVSTQGNTLTRQMESSMDIIEKNLREKFRDRIRYSFVQIGRPNSGFLMLRLKDKSEMEKMWKEIETAYPNTPTLTFNVSSWNPAELSIPNPPDFKLSILGHNTGALNLVSRELVRRINEKKIYPRIQATPESEATDMISIRPRMEAYPWLTRAGLHIGHQDLADLTRTALAPRYVGRFNQDGEDMEAYLRYPESWLNNPEELASMPIGVGGKIVPLRAVAEVKREEAQPSIYRENERQEFVIQARVGKGHENDIAKDAKLADDEVQKMREEIAQGKWSSDNSKPILLKENANQELHEALYQLSVAITLSVLLIFATMVFQFGSLMPALLVLVSIPLGVIGVGLSLFIFASSLSLNSLLGVILLNGIAVANSIILVDFTRKEVANGTPARMAAVLVGKKRLRPILMTSLTTALGMLPIALGFGEGGKILQPLGISVVGGLLFSMTSTLLLVPSLQVKWLEWSAHQKLKQDPMRLSAIVAKSVLFLLLTSLLCSTSARAESESDESEIEFAQAFDLMLDRSLRIATQEAQIKLMEARRLRAIGVFTPTLQEVYTNLSQQNFFPLSQNQFNVNQQFLTMTYNIFHGGSDYYGLEAARRQVMAEQARLSVAHQGAEVDGGSVAIALIGKTLIRDVAASLAASKAEINRVAQERFEKGLLPAQEVEKARVELENFRAALNDAETDLASTRADFKALLGTARIHARWPWKDLITKEGLNASPLLQSPFDFHLRPDWRAANYQWESDSYRVRQAWYTLLPSVDFSVSYGAPDVYNAGNTNWTAMTFVTINLLDKLVAVSTAQERSATALIDEYAKETIERRAQSDVEIFRQKYRIAVRTALSRETSLSTSQKLLDDGEKRFRMGRSTVNDFAIDQNRYSDSERLAIDGWSQVHLARIALCQALGGKIRGSGDCEQP